MKKFIFNSILIVFVLLSLTSCGGDDLDDLKAEEMNTRMLTASIIETDLVGSWNLSIMKTDSPVDLNKDGSFNQNLLLETTCFNPMSITLNQDKTFSSVNARMDFKAGETDDQFYCMGNRTDTGVWSIDGNVLTLDVEVNAKTYKETKQLTMKGNTFSFEVEKWESQKYVADPGDTSVSAVTVVSLEYTKV